MTQIYNKVNSVKDIENLRTDLGQLISWSKEWQMLFNIDKCRVMHFGYNNPKALYHMDGIQLMELGAIFRENSRTISYEFRYFP